LGDETQREVGRQNSENSGQNAAAIAGVRTRMEEAGIAPEVIEARIGEMVTQASTSLDRGDVISDSQRVALGNMTGLGGISSDTAMLEDMQSAKDPVVFDPRVDDAVLDALINETVTAKATEDERIAKEERMTTENINPEDFLEEGEVTLTSPNQQSGLGKGIASSAKKVDRTFTKAKNYYGW